MLSNVVNTIPKHNLILELGDFNAHLGRDNFSQAFHENTNNNGRLLVEHCTETNLLVSNLFFTKRPCKQWTFMSDMNDTKSQIDLILVNKTWSNSIHYCEAYSTFNSLGSDQRLVVAKVKVSLRTTKTETSNIRYDWSTLKSSNMQDMFTVNVKNRFAALANENDNITTTYANFIESIAESADKMIPIKPKKNRKRFSKDTRVISAREKLQRITQQYHQNPTNE